MTEAASTIGIKGIDDEQIRRWSGEASAADLRKDGSEKVYKDKKYAHGRTNLSRSIFIEKFLFPPEETPKLIKAWMCKEPRKGIMWVQTNRDFTKKLFMRAAYLKSPAINIIPFTPGMARLRREDLDDALTMIREAAPINMINTQLRPGISDFIPMIRINVPDQFNEWQPVPISKLDPKGRLHRFRETERREINDEEDETNEQRSRAKSISEELLEAKANHEAFKSARKRGRDSPEKNAMNKKSRSERAMINNVFNHIGFSPSGRNADI